MDIYVKEKEFTIHSRSFVDIYVKKEKDLL